jgi:fatty acid desaturase
MRADMNNEALVQLHRDFDHYDVAFRAGQVQVWRTLNYVFRVLLIAALVMQLSYPDRYGIWFNLAACGFLLTGLQVLTHSSAHKTVTLKTFKVCTILYVASLALFASAVMLDKVNEKTYLLTSGSLTILAFPIVVLHCYVAGEFRLRL